MKNGVAEGVGSDPHDTTNGAYFLSISYHQFYLITSISFILSYFIKFISLYEFLCIYLSYFFHFVFIHFILSHFISFYQFHFIHFILSHFINHQIHFCQSHFINFTLSILFYFTNFTIRQNSYQEIWWHQANFKLESNII